MPRVQNFTLGGGQIATLQKVTQLSSAQILTLNTAPVVLVTAPGAGNLIVVLGMVGVSKFGTRNYISQGADVLTPEYATTDTVLAHDYNGLLTQSAQNEFSYIPGDTLGHVVILPGADNQPIQLTAPHSYNLGPIVTATLGAGGAGYAANDTGTITNGNNDATYKVLTVGGGGAVLTFQITGAGTACTISNGNATVDGGAQPGVGAGFTVNITAVNAGDGTLKIITYYQIIQVP